MVSEMGVARVLHDVKDVVDSLYLDTANQLLYASLFFNGSIAKFDLTNMDAPPDIVVQDLKNLSAITVDAAKR
jgi:hypothetical protein